MRKLFTTLLNTLTNFSKCALYKRKLNIFKIRVFILHSDSCVMQNNVIRQYKYLVLLMSNNKILIKTI